MFKQLFKITAILGLLTLSIQASATLITVNGQSANTLDINLSTAGFVDYFDFDGEVSNTGFEAANEVIMFVVEFNNELAVISSISGPGSLRGRLKADYLATTGSFLFIDSAVGELVGLSAAWKTSPGNSDGFIFEGDNGDLDFTTSLYDSLNTDSYRFLTFDEFGVASTLISGSIGSTVGSTLINISGQITQPPGPTPVPAPGTLMLLSIGLLGLVAKKKCLL